MTLRLSILCVSLLGCYQHTRLDAGDADLRDEGVADSGVDASVDVTLDVEDATIRTGSGSVLLQTGVGFIPPSTERGWSGAIGANFFFDSDPPRPECTEETAGPCVRLTCPESTPGFRRQADLGPITVAGILHSIGFAHDGRRYREFWDTIPTPVFEPGADIVISAPGAEGPAFSVPIHGASVVVISSPEWPAFPEPMRIARGEDLAFTWEPGPIDDALHILFASEAVDARNWACDFDAVLGTGVIPSAVLATMAVGPGALHVSSRTSNEVIVDGWRIEARTVFDAESPEGRIFSGDITLE